MKETQKINNLESSIEKAKYNIRYYRLKIFKKNLKDAALKISELIEDNDDRALTDDLFSCYQSIVDASLYLKDINKKIKVGE